MSDDQKAVDPEEQRRWGNDGDDVEAHKKGHLGGMGQADEGGDDEDNDVEAHRKSFGGSHGRSDEGKDDDDGDDVEAHFKAKNA